MKLTLTLRCEPAFTVFPRAESDLLEVTEQISKLRKKRPSLAFATNDVDFLFCLLAGPQWRHHCLRFYKADGVGLVDIISRDECEQWDARLCRAVHVMRQISLPLWLSIYEE